MAFLHRIFRDPVNFVLNVIVCAAGLCLGVWFVSPIRKPPTTTVFRHSFLHERMQSQTVSIITANGFGSGVVIHRDDKTFVWTAAHVVRSVSDVEIQQKYRYAGKQLGSQSFVGHVICRLPDTDAALIWVDAPPDKLAGADWSRESLGPGEQVFSVGDTLGRDFDGSVLAGIISQVGVSNKEIPWPCVDQATLAIVPGCSGGPVFDSAGQVAGLAVGWPGMPAFGLVLPVREIYKGAQVANVTWALYGTHCPPDKILQDAVVSATEPQGFGDLLKQLFSAPPSTEPAPAKPEKKAAPRLHSPKAK